MKRKRWIFLCLLFTLVTVTIIINYTDDTIFFVNNKSRINTNVVDAYTVIDENGNRFCYKKGSNYFETINYIFSNSDVYYDTSNIYLIDEKSTKQFIVEGCHKKIIFVPLVENDNCNVKIILKDYCKNRSTNYLLDNHKYLITNISFDDYQRIFEKQENNYSVDGSTSRNKTP